MNMYRITAGLLLGMTSMLTLPQLQAEEPTRPNVIIVLTDDQGYGDLGCHGNPILKTPHLDRLMKQSVSFSDFHVAPMCTPTRGMLMTGVDAFKNGATGVAAGMTALRTDLPIAPQMFRRNGYRTAIFGKWHLGDTYPYRPQDRGFEEVLSFNGSMIPVIANKEGDSYFNPTLLENGEWRKCEGYITDIFFDRAIAWMKEIEEKEEPFFLYLPTPTPHRPNIVDKKYSEPYQGKSHNGIQTPDAFYGMIANIDENMGRLETYLKTSGLRENTILIFMSDNGTQSEQAQKLYNAGMRGKKVDSYEGGHRVPLFIRWPKRKLRHGDVIKELVTVQDVLPTIVSLCELEGIEADFDGISIVRSLRESKRTVPLRTIVNQYVIAWQSIKGEVWESTCLMRGPWRMPLRHKLNNINSDPGQNQNVLKQNPEIAKELQRDYEKWYATANVHHQRIQWLEAGGDAPNPTEFTAIDWIGTCSDTWGHAFNQKHPKGYYNIQINESGTYTVSIRHWPESSKQRLSGKIKKARLKVTPPRQTKFKDENDNAPLVNETILLEGKQAGVFSLELPKGAYEFAPDFLDENDVFLKSALRLTLAQKKQN